MNRILVIADDFTGAAEMGGIAVQHGLTAQITTARAATVSSHAHIIDTDTRQLSPADAADRINDILDQVDPTQFDWVYKKTDSVLRGPVAAELIAIAKRLGFKRSLLIPQNPSRGRTVENGQYFIDGIPLPQTGFALDPDRPATTANVLDLLSSLTEAEIVLLKLPEEMRATAIHIGDGKTPTDLDHWSSIVDSQTLPAGSADFFSAILSRKGLTPHPLPPPTIATKHRLFICGSASPESRRFVTALPHCCPMPTKLFTTPAPDQILLQKWRDSICQQLSDHGTAYIAITHPAHRDRAMHVRKTLAEVTALIIQSCNPAALFIEGGATAAAIMHRMNWNNLQVTSQLSPGVVALHPTPNPHQQIIVKPGSYPWPEQLQQKY